MIINKVLDSNACSEILNIENICFEDSWSYEMIAGEIKNEFSRIFIVCIDGISAGYISYRVIFDSAEIMRIAVLPEFRKQGLGEKLLDFMLGKLDKNTEVLLEVDESNIPAICLYEKKGFEKYSIRKNYYTHKDGSTSNAINMRLIL